MIDHSIKPDASVCAEYGVLQSELEAEACANCDGCVFSPRGFGCRYDRAVRCAGRYRSDGISVVWKRKSNTDKSTVKVHDILVHTFTLPSQRIYRVGAIRLGGTGEEGHVELEPLGYTSDTPLCIPHLMLDHMIKSGIVQLAWRKE